MERPLYGAMGQIPISSLRATLCSWDLTADVQIQNLDGADVCMVQLRGVVAQESQLDAAGVTQPDAVDKAVHG